MAETVERKRYHPLPAWVIPAGVAGALVVMYAAQMLFAALVRPDAQDGNDRYTPAEVEEVRQDRIMPTEPQKLVRVSVEVPAVELRRAEAVYRATGGGAVGASPDLPAWYPRAQSPVLDLLEKAGACEPVARRVGPDPLVLRGCDGPGEYGGTWLRVANSPDDAGTIGWRLGNATLARFSPMGEPVVPHIARDFQTADGGRTWAVTLRRIRWSDGVPVSSDDISYLWNQGWLNPEFGGGILPSQFYTGGQPARLEVLDEHRMQFIFTQPFLMFPQVLTTLSPVPAHYFRPYHPQIGDQGLIARKMRELGLATPQALYAALESWKNPDCPRLWPWLYQRFKNGSPQVFVRNPYYFAVDEQGRQLPYIDRVQVEVMDDRLLPMAAASGRMSMQNRFVRFENYTDIVSRGRAAGTKILHWIPGTRSDWLIYPNLNRSVPAGDEMVGWKARLLADRRFRQALSLAIDRPRIIDALYHGLTRPQQVEPGPLSALHSPELAKAFIDFAPERAAQMLDELWRDAGADPARRMEGFRCTPDGTPLIFYLDFCEFNGAAPAQFVVDDWARVGIRCVYRQRARNLYYLEKAWRNFDFVVWSSESEVLPLLSPRCFIANNTEANYGIGWGLWYSLGGLYGNPLAARNGAVAPPPDSPMRAAMNLYENARTAATPEAVKQAMHGVFQIAAQNLWTINLCEAPPALVVCSRDLMNVPKKAVVGAYLATPGNTGVETYAFRHPDNSALHDTADQLLHPQGLPGETAGSSGGAGRWVALLIAGIGALFLTLLCLRHPFVLRRLLIMVPTLLVISVCVFTIIQLPPGDFLSSKVMQLQETGSPPERVEQEIRSLKSLFHFDEPVVKQYLRWMGVYWFATLEEADRGLLQGYMGRSMETGKSVNSMIGDCILLTVLVSLGTILLTWLLAIPIGIYSACRLYSPGDYFFSFLGFIGMSLPAFLLALILMALTGISGLFSAKYAVQPFWDFAKFSDLLGHIWLPVLVLGVAGTAGMIRVMRANLLDELRKPYVTTARAKGLRPLKLLLKYPVRLALNPFISGIGALFPQLISGGALVAIVLSLPTVEPLMLAALFSQDMNLAGSMLMVLSLLGVFGTLVSDLLLLWLDPRIRLGGMEDTR